jgi:hypothetical protein
MVEDQLAVTHSTNRTLAAAAAEPWPTCWVINGDYAQIC